MKKVFAVLVFVALCFTALTPLNLAFAQGKNSPPPQAQDERAEFSRAVHHDTSSAPLREMFERGARTGPPRGGKDFEPGRPAPVGHSNPAGVDPLAERGVGSPSAFANPKAATNGTPVDPNARVAPPDTTGDVGPNHYVQWVNLRYSIYTLTRDTTTNEITAFTPVAGFPKQGNVVWQGFGGRCESDNDGDPIVQYDQLSDRWVLTQFAVSAQPYTQCVAVSTGPDPTGTYHRYAFPIAATFRIIRSWACGRMPTTSPTTCSRVAAASRVVRFALSSVAKCWSAAPPGRPVSEQRRPIVFNRPIWKEQHCLRPARATFC